MRGGFGGYGGNGRHGEENPQRGAQDGQYGGGGSDRHDRRAMMLEQQQHQQQLMSEQQPGRGPMLLSDPRLSSEETRPRGSPRSVERPRDVNLINCHGIAEMRTVVDLEKVASVFVNCELSRRTGAQLVIQVPCGSGGSNNMRGCTVRVTKDGKLGVYGRVGVAEARLALKRVARRIRTKAGFDSKFKKFEVRNLVAQTNLGVALNLVKIEKTVHGAHFLTEHNKLDCVRMPCRTVAATADVSASGRMLLRAKRSEEDLFAALDELMPFLRECPVEQLPDLPSRLSHSDPHIAGHREGLREGLRRRDSGDHRQLPNDRREAREFTVKIDREGGAVGLDLIHQSGTTLLIKRIKEGPIMRWNATRHRDPANTVQPGDVLVEVNGVGGSSQQMLTTIKGTNVLAFRIRRPAHGQAQQRAPQQPQALTNGAQSQRAIDSQQGMRSPDADRGAPSMPGDRTSEARTPGRRLAIRGLAGVAGSAGAERTRGETRPLAASEPRHLSASPRSSPSPPEGRPAKIRRLEDDRPRRIVGKQLDQDPGQPSDQPPPSPQSGRQPQLQQRAPHPQAQQAQQQQQQLQQHAAAAPQVRADAGRALTLRLPQTQDKAKTRRLREEIEAGASQSDGSDVEERRPRRGAGGDSPELIPREWLADPEFQQKAFIFGESADRRR